MNLSLDTPKHPVMRCENFCKAPCYLDCSNEGYVSGAARCRQDTYCGWCDPERHEAHRGCPQPPNVLSPQGLRVGSGHVCPHWQHVQGVDLGTIAGWGVRIITLPGFGRQGGVPDGDGVREVVTGGRQVRGSVGDPWRPGIERETPVMLGGQGPTTGAAHWRG